ncbi:MAG: hypothetical protein LAN36_15735 [Acidobacteriia bacterium]|nr:hypothetical protein [Terriglobia bacterium]
MPKNTHAKKRAAPAAEKVSAVKKTPRKHARRHAPTTLAPNPAPHEAAPPSATLTLPKRPRRRKRMSVDEALRKEGMGEREYAASLGRFVAKVEGNNDELKLMLDGIKEWGRHFQEKRASDSSDSRDTPVIVQLVHNVPRPERPPPGSP